MTTPGIEIIRQERLRQIEHKGYTPKHDTIHLPNELALAGACYALTNKWREKFEHPDSIVRQWTNVPEIWPFTTSDWKPSPANRLRELAKAGALIAAEIDRIKSNQGQGQVGP